MTVFVRVADSGSLSRAARGLKLSQPSVSRIIGMLEARLGTTLLLRTTRSLSLTDAGALYLERARRLLAEMEEAEQATRGLDSLHGVIRLAMPLMYGTRAEGRVVQRPYVDADGEVDPVRDQVLARVAHGQLDFQVG
ncbi:MAG: LysR family transcriptional regulator, partial [Sphingomonas sp.]